MSRSTETSDTPQMCCNCRLWNPDDEADLEIGKCTAQANKVMRWSDGCHRWRSNATNSHSNQGRR